MIFEHIVLAPSFFILNLSSIQVFIAISFHFKWLSELHMIFFNSGKELLYPKIGIIAFECLLILYFYY